MSSPIATSLTSTPQPHMQRRKLPIGIQTFAKLREDDCYYVDKTGFALDLIAGGSHYFLSRPRRFGKSLFLDTLKDLFEGRQALFAGLIAEPRWDWSIKYAVIRISFGAGVVHSRVALDQIIHQQLNFHESRFNLAPRFPDLRSRFLDLIERLHAQSGQRVVVLVDEYDKPILDNITDDMTEIAREMRDGLRNFYSVIKDADAHIKFALLTGVSKFSKVSLFSGLNNLKDITLDSRYSAICGYTEADLDSVFAPELSGLDRQQIKDWYNGYNWLGTAVYNPFDVLLLLDTRAFKAHWFETGTPDFLVNLLLQRRTFTPDLGRAIASESLLSSFDVNKMPIEALMFQTGYLTIAQERKLPGLTQYHLKFPNFEVSASLHGALLSCLSDNPARQDDLAPQLYDLLLANDFEGLHRLFKAFFDGIPHQWFVKNNIADYEGYYASVFYSYFAALGLNVQAEKSSNAGRLDMVVRFNSQIYIFEFKVVELSPEGRALQQIKDKGYANAYLALGQPIHLVGVEFSSAQRTVVGFERESLRGI